MDIKLSICIALFKIFWEFLFFCPLFLNFNIVSLFEVFVVSLFFFWFSFFLFCFVFVCVDLWKWTETTKKKKKGGEKKTHFMS
jgi:hypothetical protein